MNIILGSGSPRRQEILSFFSLPFTQASPPFDERKVNYEGDPIKYVQSLSEGKAKSLSAIYSDKAILTADTVVFHNGEIYNKPQDLDEAISFLKTLSGNWHSVFTSLSLFHKGSIKTLHEETKILFHELSLDQIQKYLKHVTFLDKAGGYAIQQGGSLIVKKIEGCYYNVMGLPLNSLKELMLSVDIDLWQHMKIL